MPTIAEATAEGAAALSAGGESNPRRTAGLLLGHALGIDRTRLLTRPDQPVDPALYGDYLGLIARRARGEPLQYITGRQEFYGLDFAVTPAVLIPRPETEFLVERVIALAQRPGQGANSRELLVFDVGTGSGCIAVAVAVHLPQARVIAIDVSPAALEVARQNAARHGVEHRVEFLAGDLLAPVSARADADFLASNPPYIPSESPEMAESEVRDWEPGVALFGGPRGLDFYSRLLSEGASYLKPGGHLVCEIGYTQLDSVREMIDEAAWELVEVTADLQAIPRTLTIRKR